MFGRAGASANLRFVIRLASSSHECCYRWWEVYGRACTILDLHVDDVHVGRHLCQWIVWCLGFFYLYLIGTLSGFVYCYDGNNRALIYAIRVYGS